MQKYSSHLNANIAFGKKSLHFIIKFIFDSNGRLCSKITASIEKCIESTKSQLADRILLYTFKYYAHELSNIPDNF